MNETIHAYAAPAKGEKFKPYEFNPGPLRDEQVEIAVEYCGLCHSDLSMYRNDFGMTAYPFVAGHEVVGKVVAIGDHVITHKLGQRVGLGWSSGSCMSCHQCLAGDHNLCTDPERREWTIVQRHGGFADGDVAIGSGPRCCLKASTTQRPGRCFVAALLCSTRSCNSTSNRRIAWA